MSTITNDTDQRMASQGPDRPAGPPGDRRDAVRRRTFWAVGGVLIVLLLLAGVVFGVTLQLANRVPRIPDAFAGLNAAARPAPGAGQTYLLVATDGHAPGGSPQRADAIMLATVAADGSHASVVSIPRDASVDVPGRGAATIDTAFTTGGASLLVGAVEGFTRVRVDHVATVDLAGLGEVADEVDGINVNVAAPTASDGVTFVAGPQHLAGPATLAYLRQRTGLPGGDLDHVRRVQNTMRALVNSAVVAGATSNPFRAYGLADTMAGHSAVDDTMSNGDLLRLAWQLHDLRTRSIDFVTAPSVPVTPGTPVIGGRPVLLLDAKQGGDLWAAVNAGSVGGYVSSHPGSALPVTPR